MEQSYKCSSCSKIIKIFEDVTCSRCGAPLCSTCAEFNAGICKTCISEIDFEDELDKIEEMTGMFI